MRHVLPIAAFFLLHATSVCATGTFTVAPDSCAAGASVIVHIIGTGTSFTAAGGSPIGVAVTQGFTILGPFMDATVQDDNHLTVTVKVPDTAGVGSWDMQVFSANYQYNAYKVFRVTPKVTPPSITVSPDTAIPGAKFSLSIVGHSTNFHVTTDKTELAGIALTLVQNGVVAYRTSPSQVINTGRMFATLNIPDSLTAGKYDLELNATTPTAYDIHTDFFLAALPTIELTGIHSASPGDKVAMDVVLHGGEVLDPEPWVKLVFDQDPTVSYSPIAIANKSDTSVIATFQFDATARTGLYDVQADAMVGPFNIAAQTKNLFTIVKSDAVASTDAEFEPITDVSISPNPASARVAVAFNLTRASTIALDIWDRIGRRIASVTSATTFGAGLHKLEWNAATVAAGTYYYRLSTLAGSHIGLITVE